MESQELEHYRSHSLLFPHREIWAVSNKRTWILCMLESPGSRLLLKAGPCETSEFAC